MMHVWMPLLQVAGSTSNGLVDVFAGLASFLLSLAIIVVTVSVIFLLGLFIWRIWKLGRVSSLLIEPLSNAMGNSDLDKLLPGLNQGLRETLATSLQTIRDRLDHMDRVNQTGQDDDENATWEVQERYALLPRSDSHYPVPEAITVARIDHLLTSLRDGNSGQARIPAQFVSLLMAPHGTRVVTTLQRRGDTLSGVQLGVSFEILDVEGKHAPVLRTFWDETGSTARGNSQLQGMTAPLSPTAAEPSANTTTVANGSGGNGGKRTSTASKTATAKLVQMQLAQAVDESRQQEGRYRELLKCAALWLGTEMVSRALSVDERRASHPLRLLVKGRRGRADRPSTQDSGQQAVLHNFIGYFHQAAALTCNDFPDSYRMAVRDFQQAISIDTQWYQPRENLADTYVMWAQSLMMQKQTGQEGKLMLQVPAGNTAKRYLYQALIHYDEAMRLFDEHGHTVPASHAGKHGDEGDSKTVERSIQLGKSTALLLIGDDENTKRAMRGVKFLRGESWDLEAERNAFLLYALARWYALADLWQLELPEGLTIPDASARQAAWRYLAYSLTRERRLWPSAAADPCFASLFPATSVTDSWEKLLLALARKNYETGATSQGAKQLSTLMGREFEEAIIAALQESVE